MKIFKKIVKWILITLLAGLIGFITLLAIWYFTLDKKPFYLKPAFQKAYKQQLVHPKIGEKVPEYVLKIVNEDLSQEQLVSLEELRGKVVVLYWFGNCKYHTQVPEALGELTKTFSQDLKIFIINGTQSNAVKQIKLKYPELNICFGGNQHREKMFCHSSSQHSVIFDKEGKIVTYGSNIPHEWIVPRLVKGEKLSAPELNILRHSPLEHKMSAFVKVYDEFFEFNTCHFSDSLNICSLNLSGSTINCANMTGIQIYELLTRIESRKFHFEEVDTVKLYQRYNLAFGINLLKFIDKKGNIDHALAKRNFEEALKTKLDSIFNVYSSKQVFESDTILNFKNNASF
jgi:hypothetical protein